VFAAGVSIGGGLTLRLQSHQQGETLYMDTPGLADVTIREQASQAIEEALKKEGEYRIIFMFTLQAGIVSPADVDTVNTVLGAITIPVNYGIFFNKLTVREMNITNELVSTLHEKLKVPTAHVHFFPRRNDLEDRDNAIVPLPPATIQFIHSLSPTVIYSSAVMTINDSEARIREEQRLKQLQQQAENERMQQVAMQQQIVKLEQEKARPIPPQIIHHHHRGGSCCVM